MLTNTGAQILEYIRTNGQARVVDLSRHVGIGNVALHRQLKKLINAGQLIKVGTSPKVLYLLTKNKILQRN